ncbi:hypothetical protein ACHAAC_15510 [Aeromicrobium sp. CF4.19]|uniref:hypothetical protein n=1 Tax=Aeromicrobium sp. CF4.19 TaxID=3373082 RepID=UPI003EE7BBA1
MARRFTCASLALTAALALGACTGGDEDTADEATADPVPTGTAEPAAENPCTLVTPETLESVNPRDNELVSTLIIGDLTFDGCTIGDVYDVSFGVRVVDNGTALEELAIGGSQAPERVDIGDEAYRSTVGTGDDVVSVTTVARFGDHVVQVRNDSLGNSDPEVRVEEDVTEALLTELGEAVPDDYEESALSTDVGAGCLLADDETVTDLVGEVQLARGGTVDGDVRCSYLGEDSDTLRVEASPESNAAELYDASADSGTREDVEVAGAERAVLGESTGSIGGTFQPDEESVGYLTVSAAAGGDLSTGPEEAVAFLERFIAAQG